MSRQHRRRRHHHQYRDGSRATTQPRVHCFAVGCLSARETLLQYSWTYTVLFAFQVIEEALRMYLICQAVEEKQGHEEKVVSAHQRQDARSLFPLVRSACSFQQENVNTSPTSQVKIHQPQAKKIRNCCRILSDLPQAGQTILHYTCILIFCLQS